MEVRFHDATTVIPAKGRIDKATIKNTCTAGVTDICQRYTGNNSGDEPTKTGSGNDGTYCVYDSTVTRRSTCLG